jgi:hypothetical protein
MPSSSTDVFVKPCALSASTTRPLAACGQPQYAIIGVPSRGSSLMIPSSS